MEFMLIPLATVIKKKKKSFFSSVDNHKADLLTLLSKTSLTFRAHKRLWTMSSVHMLVLFGLVYKSFITVQCLITLKNFRSSKPLPII